VHALTLLVPAGAVDAVSDALDEALAALSSAVEDADAGSALEEPVFDEPGVEAGAPWRRARVSALFSDEAAATAAAAALVAAHGAAGVHVLGIEPVVDHDWVRLTQAQFGPTEIAAGFWIVPTWCALPSGARDVIRLDPGRAFGTGTHPTTRMCLRWLADHGRARRAGWPRVLDYGCGSGVLAIAARRFGAAQVDAVDIDPAAVEVTRANAVANGVEVRAGLPDGVTGPYTLVVANILAAPLKLLAPLLATLVDAGGGELVLSGILARQADELRATYAPWITLDVAARDDDWILMVGTRRGAPRMA
jgi:ribosomal protein L11 methyltransferase